MLSYMNLLSYFLLGLYIHLGMIYNYLHHLICKNFHAV